MQALLVGERLVWVRGGWLPMPGKNTVESPDDLLDYGGRLVVPWNNTFAEGKIKVCVLQHIQPSMVGLKGNFALARCLANDCSDKACP